MKWSSWSEFLFMDGKGFYVWGSYGVTLVLLVAEVLMLRARKRRVGRDAPRIEAKTQNSQLESVL